MVLTGCTHDADYADDADDAAGDAGGVGRGDAEVTWTMVAVPGLADIGGVDTDTERGGSSSRSSRDPVPVRDAHVAPAVEINPSRCMPHGCVSVYFEAIGEPGI